jgi:hypothetical protein
VTYFSTARSVVTSRPWLKLPVAISSMQLVLAPREAGDRVVAAAPRRERRDDDRIERGPARDAGHPSQADAVLGDHRSHGISALTRVPPCGVHTRLLPRSQTICGFILARITEEGPAEPSRTLLRLCDLVRDGALRPYYEAVPLEQAPAVHRRIEGSHRERQGRPHPVTLLA